ncbi:hypothetical protein V8J88_08360 [Massilia sp. W12]|uniref:hypothetical protein n=1 Tax=Massilia sp. W12 TaxID=3126507 RepID=UPI0030D446D1
MMMNSKKSIWAVAAASLLSACSALQVDVDVYKGPLSNQQEVEYKQFAVMAIAAKPLIAHVLETVRLSSTNKKDMNLNFVFLKGILELYNDNCQRHFDNVDGCNNDKKVDVENFKKNYQSLIEVFNRECGGAGIVKNGCNIDQYAREKLSVIIRYEQIPVSDENRIYDLFSKRLQLCKEEGANKNACIRIDEEIQKVVFFYNSNAYFDVRSQHGLDKLVKVLIQHCAADMGARNKLDIDGEKFSCADVKLRLEDALLMFAEKILYIVNNKDLTEIGNVLNEKEKASFAQSMAFLQSLGNNLMLLIDDLKRQEKYLEKQKNAGAVERNAYKSVFASVSSVQLFNNVKNKLQGNLERLNARLEADTGEDAEGKLGATQADLDKESEQLVNANKNLVLAYKTISGNLKNLKGQSELLGQFDSSVISDWKVLDKLVKAMPKDKAYADFLSEMSNKLSLLNQGGGVSTMVRERRQASIDFLALNETKELAIEGPPTGMLRALAREWERKLEIDLFNPYAEIQKKKKEMLAVKNSVNKKKHSKEDMKREIASYNEALTLLQALHVNALSKEKELKFESKDGVSRYKEQLTADLNALPEAKTAGAGLNLLLGEIKNVNLIFSDVDTSLIKKQGETGREVFDLVIAQLRYQLLDATRRGNGAEADFLQKALTLAQEQQANMGFLRPASSYLRNAFANTAIQGNNQMPNNLLFKSMLSGIGKSYDDKFFETKLEMDKQYWQNINQIKVDGGVASNFALVKDDVGNWYVKGLSSDPEEMFRSAQSLAMFNLGGKLDLNLLGNLEDRRKLNDPDLSSTERRELQDRIDKRHGSSGAATAGIARVHEQYKKEYLDDTEKNRSNFLLALAGLSEKISNRHRKLSFSKDVGENQASQSALKEDATVESRRFEQVLTDAAPVKNKANSTKPIDDFKFAQEQGKAIIGVLRELKIARHSIAQKVMRDERLTEPQLKKVEENQKTLIAAMEKQKKLDIDLEIARKTVEIKKGLQKEGEPASKELLDAEKVYVDAKNTSNINEGEINKIKEALSAAQDNLRLAQRSQNQAAEIVKEEFDALIRKQLADRRDVVKAFLSAATKLGAAAANQ